MIDENFEFLLKTHQLVSIATDWDKSHRNNPFSLITQPSFNNFEKFFKKNRKFFSVSDLVLVEKYITAGIKKKLQKFFLDIFLWLILPLIVLAAGWKIDADRETENARIQRIEVEKNKREKLEKRLSLGEKMFFYTDFNKKAGVDCFKEKKYVQLKNSMRLVKETPAILKH